MKIYLIIVSMALFLSGCAAAYGPAGVFAPLSVGLKGPALVGTSSNAAKSGRSCSQGILVAAFGDSSLEAAKTNGGITEISTVDYDIINFLGIYTRYCTIVTGK